MKSSRIQLGGEMPESFALHQAIRQSADPMAVFDRIVEQSLVLIPHADGASLEVRRDATTLEYLSAAGTLAPFVGLRLPIDQSMSGLAVLTGEVQGCDDCLNDPRVNREAVQKTGVVSMLCVPLSEAERGVAVLKVSSRMPAAFDESDVDRLRLLATFLRTTADAASSLASVTSALLAEIEAQGASAGSASDDSTLADATAAAARFVANVMTPGLVDVHDARSRIERVIADDSLRVLFMPIIDLGNGSLKAVEALSRIDDPKERGTEWWFAAANGVGLGIELEALAIRRALEQIDQLPDGVRIAINVGRDTVHSPGFTAHFDGAPLDRITIELTEHEQITDYDSLLAALAPLREAGVRISLDDTGSGYSGLQHILRLRPNVIKLDRTLVTGIPEDPAKRALARAMTDVAHEIGAILVAEGVETDAEAECLRGIGVDYGQGYLFGRAMPVDELVRYAVALA